jgi:hypothetical protein
MYVIEEIGKDLFTLTEKETLTGEEWIVFSTGVIQNPGGKINYLFSSSKESKIYAKVLYDALTSMVKPKDKCILLFNTIHKKHFVCLSEN